MASTIITKYGSGAPLASDLVRGELAVDTENKRLYTEDSGGSVVEIGTNPAANVTFGDNVKAIFGASGDLQIYHDGSNSYIKDLGTGDLLLSGNTGVQIQSDAGENMITTAANGAVSLFYDASAKLATTSTGIDVTGTVTADGLTVDGEVFVNNTAGTITAGYLYSDSDDFVIRSYTSDKDIVFKGNDGGSVIEAMRIDMSAGGSVGIGTASPGRLVDLKESNNTDGARLRLRSATAIDTYPTIGSVEFYSDDNSTNSSGIVGSIDVEGIGTWNGTANNAAMTFNLIQGLAGTTSPIEAMRIDSSGNVGIGTPSPETNLHVVGQSNTSTTLQISSATTGYAPILNLDGVVGAAADNLLGQISASWDTHTNQVAAIRFESGVDTTNKDDGLISFWTSDAGSVLDERMRIDTQGQVRLANSSPVWDTAFSSLVTKGGWVGSQTTDYMYVGGQSYFNSAWKRLNANAASLYEQSFGKHTWYNTTSGAADSTISWTQAMTLDASGNLLVGTTSAGGSNGITLHSSGYIQPRTNTGIPAIYADREGSDGSIIELRKDGSEVGSIGTTGSNVVIGTGNTGLRFYDGGSAIIPHTAAGGSSNGLIDLGQGGFNEFKDLYLSGGVNQSTVLVSALPAAASSTGYRFMVSDSTVAASGNFGATVAGSGSNVVPVFSDGTNWLIG